MKSPKLVPSPSILLNRTKSHFYRTNSWIATNPPSTRYYHKSLTARNEIAKDANMSLCDGGIVLVKSRGRISKTQIIQDDNIIEIEDKNSYEFDHDNETDITEQDSDDCKFSPCTSRSWSQSTINSLITTNSISSQPPTLRLDKWAEPPATNFRVRGKTYNNDHTKVEGTEYMLHLFAVDVLKVEVPLLNGVCLHPNERVQKALQREKAANTRGEYYKNMPAYVFAINIFLQGPPHYHLMFYLGSDDLNIINGSNGTPSSQLASKFFFGKSDKFRDNTFKLIPQVVEGNYLVRKAVGRTPCIMGKTVSQTYIRNERFFEIILNTGSSPVATGVIKLCKGFTKSIEVELGFVLEGRDELELPEQLLGGVRLKRLDLRRDVRCIGRVQ